MTGALFPELWGAPFSLFPARRMTWYRKNVWARVRASSVLGSKYKKLTSTQVSFPVNLESILFKKAVRVIPGLTGGKRRWDSEKLSWSFAPPAKGKREGCETNFEPWETEISKQSPPSRHQERQLPTTRSIGRAITGDQTRSFGVWFHSEGAVTDASSIAPRHQNLERSWKAADALCFGGHREVCACF